MPLSTAQLNALQADVATLVSDVNALVADPAVNPLQALLDAANANIATLQSAASGYATTIAAMQSKIDAAKAALLAAAAADVVEDQRHADAVAALG